jgi:hypothetical protein
VDRLALTFDELGGQERGPRRQRRQLGGDLGPVGRRWGCRLVTDGRGGDLSEAFYQATEAGRDGDAEAALGGVLLALYG